MTCSLDHHVEICVADMADVTIHTVYAIQDLLGIIASLDREIRLVSRFDIRQGLAQVYLGLFILNFF